MLTDFLLDQASLYAAGLMMCEEREQFELVLEFHHELREFAVGLSEVTVALVLAHQPSVGLAPSRSLKTRITSRITDLRQQTSPDGMVMSGPDGLVQWVNPAFSAMCGYSLDELRGKNLGPILQGEQTDREPAERMRRAVHEHRPCTETILNYHKNGTSYWAEVAITSIFDNTGELLWFVARERELTDYAAA